MPDLPSPLRLYPMAAPWHPGTDDHPFNGIKWLSYAPNMLSTDIARREGFHDALLLRPDNVVLEGPTFCVAWVIRDRLEMPALDLGILQSITRKAVLEAADRRGLEVDEGAFSLRRLRRASEVVALSTIKEVMPVGAVGEAAFEPGPIGADLAAAFRAIVRAETG
jgi:branched-subunit amino acid aminotransferase/4-amino-4-deoxychorismate lyase